MPFWPFRRKPVEPTTPEEVRDRLIAAASGRRGTLRAACERHRAQVIANLDLMRKVPPEIRSNPADLESRLLAALAGLLPPDSPERPSLIERAAGLDGSLVARASVRLMALCK